MKILVTAASRHDATAEIGTAIAAVLRGHGHQVEEMAPENVEDVGQYDAVVMGSAVYVGRWLEPSRSLVDRHATQLAERPVWLFSSGPLGDPPKPADDPDVSALVEATRAVEHRVFTGKLDKSSLGPLERTVARAVRAPEGDYRDWDAIKDWAEKIAASLS